MASGQNGPTIATSPSKTDVSLLSGIAGRHDSPRRSVGSPGLSDTREPSPSPRKSPGVPGTTPDPTPAQPAGLGLMSPHPSQRAVSSRRDSAAGATGTLEADAAGGSGGAASSISNQFEKLSDALLSLGGLGGATPSLHSASDSPTLVQKSPSVGGGAMATGRTLELLRWFELPEVEVRQLAAY